MSEVYSYQCKSLREWFADARSGCCNFPAFRYRFAAIGMKLEIKRQNEVGSGTRRHREYMRQWKENNPHLVSKHQFYRRKASVVSAEEAAAIKQIYNLAKSNLACVCYLCGSITGKAERQVDHSLPICRGGDHSAANLAIACTDCNLRKHAKTELEFLLQEHEIEGPLLV